MDKTTLENRDHSWKSLYRIGGVAPLITLIFYLSQWILIILSGDTYPTTPDSWFAVFQRNKFLGLIFLNALDMFSIAILGLMFLALYIALRQINPSYMTIAACIAFLGIAVFVTTRAEMVTAALSLSDQYTVTSTEAQRSQLQAALQAVMSLSRATPETIGYLFLAVAGLIVSIIMLKSESFNKATAYVGVLGSGFTFTNQISLVVAPTIAGILMPINGLIWLVWWLMVSRGLFTLSKRVI